MSSIAAAPTHLLPYDLQISNEYRFNRKHLNKYITEMLERDYGREIDFGVSLVEQWLSKTYYDAKNIRLAQLSGMDLRAIVLVICTQTVYCQTAEEFVSMTSQMAGCLGFSEHRDSIETIAEMTAVVCETNLFDIVKEDRYATLMIQSKVSIPADLADCIARSRYLPPMVVEPEDIHSNFESPYLTHNDSVILGRKKSHSEDVCLDTINLQNKIAFSLNDEFLKSVDEQPTFDIEDMAQLRDWKNFKHESQQVYLLMLEQGNKFYLTNKVDNRGRTYAQGYHIHAQGTPYKKAMLDLEHTEIVTGVPA